MTGRMATWRLVATTNVSARPADSEVNPLATGFQTFLATARAWFNLPDGAWPTPGGASWKALRRPTRAVS